MERITVRGGGIFGLAVGYELARRGAPVRLVERDRIGAGASGGLVGALSPHAPGRVTALKAVQVAGLRAAAAFWGGAARTGGMDPHFARTGRLQPLPDDASVEQARARGEVDRDLWGGVLGWRVEALAADAWRGESPTGLWVRDDLSARLNPRRALRALASAIVALGGEVVEGRDVAADGPEVWATGAAGLSDLGLGSGVKGQAALFKAAVPPDAPQLYVDGLYAVPHGDGTVAVGSTTEAAFDDASSTDAALELLIERARGLSPLLADAPVIDRWAGLRPRSQGRAPVLGVLPGRPGLFVANGGFKIGFSLAPEVARLMADLVLDGVDGIPAELRAELRAG